MQSPLDYLKHYYKHDAFIEPQEAIIQAILNKNDTLALLPTGGGKSVCFQIPTLMSEGICVVISPLIALMKDQVSHLEQKGIKAVFLQANQTQDDLIRIFDNCKFGKIKFLYLSPEFLQSEFIQTKISELEVCMIAVDEAHCISEWGHDFRPAYLKIAEIKEKLPDVPFLALTATATPKVLDDIKKYLILNRPQVFKKSFFRANIAYQIIKTETKNTKLLALLQGEKNSGIVYVNTRKQTKMIAKFLNANQIKSSFYHGGLSPEEKDLAYKNWMRETTPIMVATNAFGMGIDKANVRIVIHYNSPNSIENYIQETGRAGRDQKPSKAYLLKSESDTFELKSRFKKNTPSLDFIEKVYKQLCQYYRIPFLEIPDTWFDFDWIDFCKTYNFDLIVTYNSIKTLEREGVLQMTENFYHQSEIYFKAGNNTVLNYAESHQELGLLIKTILRHYGGLFENKSTINLGLIASKLNRSKKEITTQLNQLVQDNLIDFKPANTHVKLLFLVPREDDKTINTIAKNIVSYNQHQAEKLKAVIDFMQNDNLCRVRFILDYFGEPTQADCGHCDVCQSKLKTPQKQNYTEVAKAILTLLQNVGPLNSSAIVLKLKLPDKLVITTLQLLLENRKIIVNSQHQFQINTKS